MKNSFVKVRKSSNVNLRQLEFSPEDRSVSTSLLTNLFDFVKQS